ncbi:MAG: chemotaxis protein CheD [Candidatus Hodarchaeales archaeon]
MATDDALVTRYVKISEIIFRVGYDMSKPLRVILGSCVGLTLFDPVSKLSGFAHMMMPEREYKEKNSKFRGKGKYVDVAIPYMLKWFKDNGIPTERLEAKLAGGAFLIPRNREINLVNFSEGNRNVQITMLLLLKAGVKVVARDVGKDIERVMIFFPGNGKVLIREPLTGKNRLL